MTRNFSISFYLKKLKKPTAEDERPIYIRITVNKHMADAATGKKCKEAEWKNGLLKGSTVKARTFNNYLRQLEIKVYEAHTQLVEQNAEISARSICDQFLGKEPAEKMLIGVFKEHNDKMKALVGTEFAPMTLLRYQTALRCVLQ